MVCLQNIDSTSVAFSSDTDIDLPPDASVLEIPIHYSMLQEGDIGVIYRVNPDGQDDFKEYDAYYHVDGSYYCPFTISLRKDVLTGAARDLYSERTIPAGQAGTPFTLAWAQCCRSRIQHVKVRSTELCCESNTTIHTN